MSVLSIVFIPKYLQPFLLTIIKTNNYPKHYNTVNVK